MPACFKALVLAVTVHVVLSGLTPPPECFAPTKCDTNFASCTIGLDCLGSLITMCGLGNLTPNGACQTFPNTNQTYCECNECVGIVNELFYDCSCGGPAEFVCPTGFNLVSCVSWLTGATQYSCCKTARCEL